MKVRYGAYTHEAGEVALSIARTPSFGDGGQRVGYTERWTLDGMLLGDDFNDLTANIQALEAAYAKDGQDIALLTDAGAFTAHRLLSKDCRGGTRVVEGVSYPDGTFSQYVNFRSYTVSVEGEVRSAGNNLLAWYETVTWEGTTGRMEVYLQTLTGVPDRQTVAEHTSQRVVQEGSAIGQFRHPVPPPPIWPDLEHLPRRQISKKSPRRSGPVGKPEFVEFEVSWRYEFESIKPLQGEPHKQPER